jgi:prepilin-type N-terminal cleavage/methylation domain-containing protein
MLLIYAMRSKTISGFTLVEISIALVIIGFIVGGILVGRDMIRQSQLRSVFSDVDKIRAAIRTFQTKYNCLPGDCANATDFFSGTDNGNGNYDIDFGAGNGSGDNSPSANKEIFLVWQHLSLAGLMPGQYTGVHGPGSGYEAVIGVNVPASKYPNGGYTLMDANVAGGSIYRFARANYGRVIEFGSYYPGNETQGFLLTGLEAFSIDQKLDDGLPGTGSVLTYPYPNFLGNTNCVTTGDPSTSVYNTTANVLACPLQFGKAY